MKKLLSVIILFLLLFSQGFALSPVIKEYNNSADFLKSEGNVCESATDWCNTISIIDGKLWASTMMYCEDIYGDKWHEKWSCKKYKDNIVWGDTDEHWCKASAWYSWNADKQQCTRPWEDNDNTMCTMQYDPVCAEVQVQCIKAPCYPITQTFWNACSAWKNKVLYKWECDSYVNMALYNRYTKWQDEIQNKLKNISTEKLSKVVELIDELIPKTKMLRIVDSIIKQRITKYVFLKNVIQKELSERN